MEDQDTVDYFDEYTPRYWENRVNYAIEVINQHAREGEDLLDIGCGVGNVLQHLAQRTPLAPIYGMDVSSRCLAKARETLGCETLLGSIIDDDFVRSIGRQFQYATMMAVLHHLIGRSRTQSRSMAYRAVANALSLVKPGGRLIIIEPVFYPPVVMDALFYVKKFTTRITSRRIPLFGNWNNIGAPVVSFYTNEDLHDMIERAGGSIESERCDELEIKLVQRLAFIRKRFDTTIVIRKVS